MKIMSNSEIENDYKVLSRGPHWSYGFLRVRHHDFTGAYCYEQPNGDLVMSMNEYHKNMMMLECRQDIDGEIYVCICSDRAYIVNQMKNMDNTAMRLFIRYHDNT